MPAMRKRYEAEFWPVPGMPDRYQARVREFDFQVEATGITNLEQALLDAIVAHGGRPSGITIRAVRP